MTSIDESSDAHNAHDEQLAMLLTELMDAANRGESVDFEAVCREHPKFAAELRQLWGAAQLAEVAALEIPDDLKADDHLPPPGDVAATLPLPFKHGDYELLEELADQMNAGQRQRASELGQWKDANPILAKRCRAAAEALGQVQTEFIENLTFDVNENHESMMDGEFVLNEL